jgi:alkaline phosphatase D
VEFVGPAVTSLGLETNALAGTAAALLKSANPHLKFNDVTRKGYVLVDVTKERVQADWYFVADHKTKTDGEELGAAFTCAAGTPHLSPTDTATTPKPNASPLAPA